MSERIWFARTEGLISSLYRALHLTRWDTVALELGDDIYRVTPSDGVICTDLNSFMENTHDRSVIDIDIKDNGFLSLFLQNQLGKKFDWLSFFHIPTSDVYRDTHWGNADLIAEALTLSIDQFTYSYDNTTPTELWVDLQAYNYSGDK